MVSNKKDIYPNGIVSGYFGQNDSTSIYVESDNDVNILFQEYIANPAVVNQFDFKTRLVKTALKLMRDSKRFFIHNVTKNDFVPPPVKDFLLDTLKYIKTGRREVAISICKHSLISATHASNVYRFKSNKLHLVDELSSDSDIDGIELLAKWVSLPNGIEDLIWFTKLIFSPRS